MLQTIKKLWTSEKDSTIIGRKRRMHLSEVPEFVGHVDGVPDVADATIRSYRDAARSVEIALGYDPLVSEITPQLIYQWTTYLAESMSVISANSRKRSLRAMLNKLHGRGVIDRSFSEHFKVKPEPPRNVKAVSEENKNKMVRVATPMWRAAIETLWATGCRRGGLLSMKRQDFQTWEKGRELYGSVKVLEKGERPRTVFMQPAAVKAINLWLDLCQVESIHLFCNSETGAPLCYTTPTNMLRKIAKRAKIPKDEPTNPHAFRHAFAIRQLDNGTSPEVVADWMGIDVATLLRFYTIRDENRLRELYMQRAVA